MSWNSWARMSTSLPLPVQLGQYEYIAVETCRCSHLVVPSSPNCEPSTTVVMVPPPSLLLRTTTQWVMTIDLPHQVQTIVASIQQMSQRECDQIDCRPSVIIDSLTTEFLLAADGDGGALKRFRSATPRGIRCRLVGPMSAKSLRLCFMIYLYTDRHSSHHQHMLVTLYCGATLMAY